VPLRRSDCNRNPSITPPTLGGARPKKPAARYRGTEQSDPRRGAQTSTSERRTRDEKRVSHERRKLFENDAMEQDEFTDQFMGAAEAKSQAKLDELIAIMDKKQLLASLQHMALKWKALQGESRASAPPYRYPTSDSQSWQPTTKTHTAAATTSTPRARHYRSRDRAVSPPAPVDVGTLEPKREPITPTAAQQITTTDTKINSPTDNDNKKRKPAAKLERYTGQGASVKSFIAQFETHAKYFQWTEQDRVFQLKNSLTGIAA